MNTTSIIALIMMILAIIDIKSFQKGKHKDFKSIIISLGVLGTFIGIFQGLLNFDTLDIKGSVPELLEGLKTAFSTSIIGMIISNAISIYQSIKGHIKIEDELVPKENELSENFKKIVTNSNSLKYLSKINLKVESLDSNIKNLSKEMNEVKIAFSESTEKVSEKLNATFENKINKLSDNLIDLSEKQTEYFTKGQESIKQVSDKINSSIENSSAAISKSIKNFDKSNNDNYKLLTLFLGENIKKLNNTMEKTTEILAKGATEEIIKALEKVIVDFNNNLIDSFGDNFKQLNEAVINMITWQKNNKNHIETIETSLKTSSNNMDKITETLNSITDNYQKIDKTHLNLQSIISTNDKQLKDLEIHFKKLAEIGEKSKLMVDSIDNFSEKIKGSLTSQSKTLEELIENSAIMKKEIEKQLPNSLNEMNTSLSTLTDKFKDDYNDFLIHMSKMIKYNSSVS